MRYAVDGLGSKWLVYEYLQSASVPTLLQFLSEIIPNPFERKDTTARGVLMWSERFLKLS